MSLYIRKYLFILQLLIVGGCLLLQNCGKIDSLSLGATKETFGVETVDTFTVDTRTALLDPLPTATSGNLLIGALKSDEFGDTQVSSYARFSLPDLSTELATGVRYDSLTLELHYSRYYYGDTSRRFGIAVHRLEEEIDPISLSIALEDDEYPVFASGETIFSNQIFRHNSNKLGYLEFTPKPNRGNDTISIRLDNELGKELFRLAQNKDSKIVNLDEFIEYFKGLALIPDASNEAVIGLRDSISLNVHYSYESETDGRRESAKISIVASDGSYTYHHENTDRTKSLLQNLNYTTSIESSRVGNQAFIQGLSGVITQLRFPYVNEFVRDGIQYINKAELVVETGQSNGYNMAMPDSLILMKANKYGTPTSLIQDKYGNGVAARFVSDNTWGANPNGSYTFNVTDLISSWAYNNKYREDESIFLSLPLNKLFSTVDQLVIPRNNDRPAIKLIITYTKLNENEMVF